MINIHKISLIIIFTKLSSKHISILTITITDH